MAKFGRDVKRRFSKIEKRSTEPYIHVYSVHTVFLAGKSPYIWPNTVCIYTVLANPARFYWWLNL